jgi:hypothetical protein
MSRTTGGRVPRASSGGGSGSATPSNLVRPLQDYFWSSELPLTGLLFLLPMLVFYEIGTHYYTSDWARQTETRVLAFTMTRRFMELFGATGRYLPSLAVVGILLAWHIARRDQWRLRFGVAMGMIIESALLAFPLVALSRVVGQYLPLFAATEAPWQGGVVFAIGAGVYEELIFRLAAFTLLNIILVDLLRLEKLPAYLLILVASSLLFASYHYWSPLSSPFRWSDYVFRAAAGIYFGALFMARGFGVTAGCHAAYDIYYFVCRALA